MSENRRFYWLKLSEDFFDDDTMSWLEEQENGKEYCLFYLKLCLKSLKTEGVLIRTVGEILIPYDTKKLADLTKTDYDTVFVAMELFKRIGLVQIMEHGEIYLAQLPEMVGSETDRAKSMREKRAREKLEGNNVTPVLPKCSEMLPEIEKEIDIELEKDTEIDNITTTTTDEAAELSTNLSTIICGQVPTNAESVEKATELVTELQNHYWGSSPTQYDIEKAFTHLYKYTHINDDTAIGIYDDAKAVMLRQAFELAAAHGKNSWHYIEAIYDKWEKTGIATENDLELHETERVRKKMDLAV